MVSKNEQPENYCEVCPILDYMNDDVAYTLCPCLAGLMILMMLLTRR